MDLEELVIRLVIDSPGKKAREIADVLGIDRRSVNQVLYYGLGTRVHRDENFGWRPTVGETGGIPQVQDDHVGLPPLEETSKVSPCPPEIDQVGGRSLANPVAASRIEFEVPALVRPQTEKGSTSSSHQAQCARMAWRAGRKTYVVTLQRMVFQTASVEIEAKSYSEAEDTVLSMADDEEAICWDNAGIDKPKIIHTSEWDTRVGPHGN